MTISLITGANRGLGLETVRRLIAAGHTVFLGARKPELGQAAAAVVGGHVLPLDVTSGASVEAAVEIVRRQAGCLDVLVNNAGIIGSRKDAAELTVDEVKAVYDTNVFGVLRVTQAFIPLLRRSGAPTVVNVSSGLGSLAIAEDPECYTSLLPVYQPNLDYNSSKAALNMLTAQYAKAFPGITFNAVDPGWTATNLNGFAGVQSVEEGAEVIVHMAVQGADSVTGRFHGNSGSVPW